MVNGRTLEEELQSIDEFFEQQTVEEFEDMAVECGINEILPSEQSSYNKVYDS